MYRMAIVEDDREFVKELQQYLLQYAKEEGQEFEISVFYDGAEILDNYTPKYDLILLDIEMPKVNGMDAAEKIRETDENVVMMFITNMAQYAIRGYSVGALDFVMKPITYYTFSMKIKRALKRVQKKELPSILLSLPDGVKKLEVRQIYYLEVQNHMVYYHTDEGEFVMRGTLQSAENALPSAVFAKCNHWYLVNLMHVTEVRKNTAVVGPFELEISRRNRAGFLKALAEYMGGTPDDIRKLLDLLYCFLCFRADLYASNGEKSGLAKKNAGVCFKCGFLWGSAQDYPRRKQDMERSIFYGCRLRLDDFYAA